MTTYESPLMDITEAERLSLTRLGYLAAFVGDIQVNDEVFIPPVSRRPGGRNPLIGTVVRVVPAAETVVSMIIMNDLPRHASYGKVYPCWIKR